MATIQQEHHDLVREHLRELFAAVSFGPKEKKVLEGVVEAALSGREYSYRKLADDVEGDANSESRGRVRNTLSRAFKKIEQLYEERGSKYRLERDVGVRVVFHVRDDRADTGDIEEGIRVLEVLGDISNTSQFVVSDWFDEGEDIDVDDTVYRIQLGAKYRF